MAFDLINRNLLLIKVHYFVGIAASAPICPFLTTMLRQRGYSPVIIAWIFTSIPLPSILIKPLVGAVTDKYKCRKSAAVLNSIVICSIVCAMMFTPGAAVETESKDSDAIRSPVFWLFATTTVLLLIAHMVRNVLEDSICVDMLGVDRNKFGNQRVWGAIGWGTMSIVSGFVIDWFSKGKKYKNYTPGFIIALVFQILDTFVLWKIEIVQSSNSTGSLWNVKIVLKQIRVAAFFLWVFFFGFFYAFIWNYVFWYMEDLANIYYPETKPWIKTIQGFSLTVQCFGGEVPFFFISSYIIERVNHMNVFSLSFFVFAVRFFLYSIIRNPVWVLPVEIFNGVTFALTYSATISYAAQIAPPGTEGALQGLIGTFQNGIGTSIGSFVGGYMFNHFGSIDSFKLLSAISLVLCLIQVITNQLISRLSKDQNVNKEQSIKNVLYSSVQSKN